MVERSPTSEREQPPYEALDALLAQISGQNGEGCRQMLRDLEDLFKTAPGSSHNHQAWPGGYYDHVIETMNIALILYDTLNAARPLPFERSDALLVMFLHDLEKPFKYTIDPEGNLTRNPDIPDKAANAAKRNEVMQRYGIKLTAQQANAMRFVEGIRDEDYRPDARLMGELAALCHSADVLSARLFYNYPLPAEQDQWLGAGRINPAAASFVLTTEIAG